MVHGMAKDRNNITIVDHSCLCVHTDNQPANCNSTDPVTDYSDEQFAISSCVARFQKQEKRLTVQGYLIATARYGHLGLYYSPLHWY